MSGAIRAIAARDLSFEPSEVRIFRRAGKHLLPASGHQLQCQFVLLKPERLAQVQPGAQIRLQGDGLVAAPLCNSAETASSLREFIARCAAP